MDKYKAQLRYASDADDKAAMYLRWAADALKKQWNKYIKQLLLWLSTQEYFIR